MTHPFLDPPDVGLPDHARPERVAQIVETERAEPTSCERVTVSAAERVAVEGRPGLAGEDEVVIPGEPPPPVEPGEGARDVGRHRHDTHLGGLCVVSCPAA